MSPLEVAVARGEADRPGLWRPGVFVFGRSRLVRLSLLLHSSSKTEEGDHGRGGHHPCHHQKYRPGGVGEVESNEVGDRSSGGASLGLCDPARLESRLPR